MNDYIINSIILYIKSKHNDKNKNELINIVEEYIEWLNYSKSRFNKNNYTEYLDMFQKYQAEILLDEFDKGLDILNDYQIMFSIRRNDYEEVNNE